MFRVSASGLSDEAAQVGKLMSMEPKAPRQPRSQRTIEFQALPSRGVSDLFDEDGKRVSKDKLVVSSRSRGQTGSSASSKSSSSSSSSAAGDEEDMPEDDMSVFPTRRSTRGTRGLDEKSVQWKIVHLPQFQTWARKSHFTQDVVRVPTIVDDVMHGAPLPEPALRLPKSRRSVVKSHSEPPNRKSFEVYIAKKDSEGVLKPFVRFDPNMVQATGSYVQMEDSIVEGLDSAARKEAVLKTANGEVMNLLVTNVAARQAMRFTESVASKSSGMQPQDAGAPSRRAVTKVANNFDVSYARVRRTIEANMSFRPIQRAHSVDLGARVFRSRQTVS